MTKLDRIVQVMIFCKLKSELLSVWRLLQTFPKEEGTSRGILIDGLDELLAQLELDAARKPHRIHHFDLIVPDQFNGASVRKLVALRGIEVETWQIGGRSCCGVKCETRDDKTYHFLPLPGSDAEITSATSWPHKSS